MRKILYGFLAVFMLIALTACGGSDDKAKPGDSKGKITVGGKDFTEQHILAKITSVYLKENGYDVDEASSMGSTVVRSALENKQIDVYWEYTGTALVVYQKEEAETDSDQAYEKVKANDEKNGITWLDKANFNNTYALMMRQDEADKLGVKSISDLMELINEDPGKLKLACSAEFYARDDGIKGLEKHYGFSFPSKNVIKMDSGLLYNALKDGQVDVSVGFGTDGRIQGFDLVVLEDDKQFFPAYNGAPVVRTEVLEKSPELAELLNNVAEKLTNESMMSLNYAVDVEHKDVTEVSREWLKEVGLLE